MAKYLSKQEWQAAEDRYVYGDPITYKEVAELLHVSGVTISNHASPSTGNWREKRNLAQKELRLDSKARMVKEQDRVNANRSKAFEARYEDSTEKLNDLLDMLLEYFVPRIGAPEADFLKCKDQLDLLSANQKATLVVKCTERLSGVAKTRQLLSGGATERLLIDLKNSDGIELSPESEAQIEGILAEARNTRSSSDL